MVLKAGVLVATRGSSTMLSAFLGLVIWQNDHLHRYSTLQFSHFCITRVQRGTSALATGETYALASCATHKPAAFSKPPISSLFFFPYSFWLLF